MNKTRLKTLAACIALLGTSHAFAAGEQKADDAAESSALETVIVKGNRNKHQTGRDRVYTREVVNLYKGKEEVETFKGNTVSDLFSGMVGVYSGDARNSGALDPNVRGVQGQGRVPVTIDGTEQAITVWRGMAGASNRNYIDPNIVSSVYVEKGPSFNRDVKSGIGGSVALKTIDADDIVPEGQKYGFEVKMETSDNSISPRSAKYAINVDYRTLPNPEYSALGMWRLFLDDSDRLDPRFGSKHKFFKDTAYRIAAATKQDNFDAMIAYAYRKKGNYFSGKKGGERYGYFQNNSEENIKRLIEQWGGSLLKPSVPIMGVFYNPGGEVANSSLETKSWLGKFTYRLPDNQSLKLGIRHTDSTFGEIMPSRIFSGMGFQGNNYSAMNRIAEWPQAWVKQRAYNLDYTWKPENSRWIDLQASIWTTRTRSKTNSAGGVPGDVTWTDEKWNEKYYDWKYGGSSDHPRLEDGLPNINNRFTTKQGQALYATNNRNGFTFSNRMKLADKLQLTVLGDFQNEKLRTHNEFSDLFLDDGNIREQKDGKLYPNLWLDQVAYPRNGRRREFNLGFNFRYDPVRWLTLTAGARYTHFTLQDDSLKRYLDNGGIIQANRGYVFRGTQVAGKAEYERYLRAQKIYEEAFNTGDFSKITPEVHRDSELVEIKDGVAYSKEKIQRNWEKDRYGKLHIENHPNLQPEVRQMVENPAYDPNDPASPRMVPKYDLRQDNSRPDGLYRTPLTEAEKQRTIRQSGSGWAPAFSATVNFTDHARAYLRYTEILRYPSIFEGTYGISLNARGSYGLDTRFGYQWRPERAQNWEIGYIHDLTGLFPKMRRADFRINYFHNVTKNIIDRNEDLEFEQYDKQTRTGAELSARFDSGRFYGSLGVVRAIRNEVCDKAYGFSDHWQDWAIRQQLKNGGSLTRVPHCFPGGANVAGYLRTMQQPQWSVNAELGTRLLNNKLDLGTRFNWFNNVHTNRLDSWRDFQREMLERYGEDMSRYIAGDAQENMRWAATATVDAYVRYRINKHITAEIVGTNLTNRYYMDPFSRSYMPAPGRTLRIGITGKW